MKRWISIFLVAITALVCFIGMSAEVETVVAERAQMANSPVQAPSPIASPPPSNIASPELQCQGCHASGKTLPFLGGASFHTKAHTDYGLGFHALAIGKGGNGASCLDCHTKNGDMTTILPASDPGSTINRASIAETCGRCHGDKAVMKGSGISDRPLLSYRESVHAKAMAQGNTSAAVCTDCHNSHDILPASNAQSSIAKVNIPKTCGKCHQNESHEFVQSVHGKAVERGVSRSPVCTDCHGIHKIERSFDPASTVASAAIGSESCAKCHEGVALTQEFGIAADRVGTYKDSYHGLASKFGSKLVANCASCHGVHNILPSADPKSMINAANLAQTCGQCHVGASENFAKGSIHLSSALTSDATGQIDMALTGTRVVRWIYMPLIVLVIGGMLMHNALVWRKKVAEKRKSERRTIVRLTRNQRTQHWLLLSSFMLLVLSGFALQYPDSWLAWLLGSSEPWRRVLHRVAAIVMLATGAYHVLYLLLTSEGRSWVSAMLPRGKDVRDVLQNFGYYLGLKVSKPRIARFGYAEKAEYWAVVWGTMIMGLTGLLMWFKISVFWFLPRYWVDISLAIHFYEAVLATLAIVVWHFYQVIFDPDVYPINFAFLDGNMSEELYKEEHELDYERLKKAELQQTQDESTESLDGPDNGVTPSRVDSPGD